MGNKNNNNSEKLAFNQLEADEKKFRESKSTPKRKSPYKRDKKKVVYDQSSEDE